MRPEHRQTRLEQQLDIRSSEQRLTHDKLNYLIYHGLT